jgi:FkbM family methyltransferase
MSICELDEREAQRGVVPFLRGCYQSYRNWQKRRGREKKHQRRLQAMGDFYGAFIKEGDICFDIGANMGNRTEAFLALGAKVIAVEPQENCAIVLREKFGANTNFILVNKALDKVEGEREFFISNAHTLCSMSKEWIKNAKDHNFFEGSGWDSKKLVQTTTLDALVKSHGLPAFCKIDVEGFEFEVLQGLSQPIKTISLEYTFGFMEPIIDSINYLAQLSDVEFNYSEGESLSFALPKWVAPCEIVAALNHLSGEVPFGDLYARFTGDQ